MAAARQFKAVVVAWKVLGLLEEYLGYQGKDDFDGGEIRTRGWATRFRATAALLRVAEEYGITPSTVRDNYRVETARTFPIELRATKKGQRRGTGNRGARMKVMRSNPKVLALAADVLEVNVFLSQHAFNFEPAPVLRRVFNNGDQHGFDWNRGGRLYCGGKDSYQHWHAEDRKSIKIDGEDVVELDIRSSQPTLAYALAGEPLPEGDLYEVDGLPRLVLKRLMTAYLGKGGRPKAWPEGLKGDYWAAFGRHLTDDIRLKDAVDAVEAAHPLLLRLSDYDIDVHRLQHVESEILLRAMLRLIREHQVPSLPVHDCLIVRCRDQDVGEAYLDEAFFSEVGVHPHITRKNR